MEKIFHFGVFVCPFLAMFLYLMNKKHGIRLVRATKITVIIIVVSSLITWIYSLTVSEISPLVLRTSLGLIGSLSLFVLFLILAFNEEDEGL